MHAFIFFPPTDDWRCRRVDANVEIWFDNLNRWRGRWEHFRNVQNHKGSCKDLRASRWVERQHLVESISDRKDCRSSFFSNFALCHTIARGCNWCKVPSSPGTCLYLQLATTESNKVINERKRNLFSNYQMYFK